MALFRFPKRRLRKLVHEGEYARAIQLGAELEPRFKNDEDFLFIMGGIYYVVEDSPKALDYLDRSLRAAGADDPETLHLKANVHVRLGEYGEAVACCHRILAEDPDHGGARWIVEELEKLGGDGDGAS